MAEETIFNNWVNITGESRNELVFEHKHKDYGAFIIRTNYNRTVAMALIIALTGFLFAISIPAIIDYINSKSGEVVTAVDITANDLLPPPPDDPLAPPPPPPPPPPVMETVKFTPPVVEDEKVDDAPPPVITEDTPQISTVTQEGNGNDDIVIPENTGTGVVEPVIEEPLRVVEQMPQYPGGDLEMMKYIQKSIQYPQVEKEAGISGTCYVTFVVEKDGSITDVKTLRGVSGGPGCDKEALRVVKAMPAWKAGKQNGREVRVQFNLPIKFTLR